MRSITAAPLLGLLVLGACSDATQPDPDLPGRLEIADGDRQTGLVGRRLPRPLQVTVRTDRGVPVPGVVVRWQGDLNGQVDRTESVTDGAGRAVAWFTLGPSPGTAAAFARTDADSVGFLFHAREESPGELPYGEIRTLALATFDGSGETVHPDHLHHAASGFGLPRHLAVTPYPGGNAAYELPSVFASDGIADWLLEPGAPNPVVPAPAQGHMSDPDIVFDPDAGEIRMYYRHVVNGRNVILLVRTKDGVTWSPPVTVLSAPSHGIVSPTVVRRGPGDWLMWYIDSGSAGCSASSTTVVLRHSTDGIGWGAPRPLAMSHDGLHPWHIEVQWIAERGEYWALYNSKSAGGCATPVVFLARSPDGATWTPLRTPVLTKGAHPDLDDIVYRGTFEYDHARQDVTFWHSGATYSGGRYVWRSAVQVLRLEDVLALAAGPRFELADLPPAPAELVDWP